MWRMNSCPRCGGSEYKNEDNEWVCLNCSRVDHRGTPLPYVKWEGRQGEGSSKKQRERIFK